MSSVDGGGTCHVAGEGVKNFTLPTASGFWDGHKGGDITQGDGDMASAIDTGDGYMASAIDTGEVTLPGGKVHGIYDGTHTGVTLIHWHLRRHIYRGYGNTTTTRLGQTYLTTTIKNYNNNARTDILDYNNKTWTDIHTKSRQGQIF